ncbi:sugar transport protein 5-like [Vigna umbellata]|uniref:sugar transport protein 5-like n=1 Tax=Vigna umbellata TaxID=87088 RepID=UPI001F5F54A5|nr:sugar transport protein 5-like [Vigna umbellata]
MARGSGNVATALASTQRAKKEPELKKAEKEIKRFINMAGGVLPVDSSPITNGFPSKITLSIVITCIVAASSGLLFGYDLGVSGGVTTMVPFLEKFFPDILRKIGGSEVNMYCVYDSQVLTLFTSSLYLAGLVSSLVASRVTTAIGRRNTILLGGAVVSSRWFP